MGPFYYQASSRPRVLRKAYDGTLLGLLGWLSNFDTANDWPIVRGFRSRPTMSDALRCDFEASGELQAACLSFRRNEKSSREILVDERLGMKRQANNGGRNVSDDVEVLELCSTALPVPW